MKWKKEIEGLKAYQPGKSIEAVQKEFGLSTIHKLASNENPYGCSPKVEEFLAKEAFNFALYPDGAATDMRSTVSEHLGVSGRKLIFGNGSDELISIISRSLLRPGVNTVMAKPTFSQYALNARIEGAEVREVPLKDGTHDLVEMLEQIDHETAVVWLCSPNNPTGVVIDDSALTAFLDKVPQDVLVVLDEAYFEYITNPTYRNTLSYIDEYPNLLILRTFSKAYGLASFRVGYGMASEPIIAKLEPVRGPFNTTVLSQAVVSVAVEDQSFIDMCRSENEKGKQLIEKFCTAHNLHFYPSDTNFILMEVKTDSDIVFQKLMEKGYIVRSGNVLGVPGYVRVTIGTREQNEGFLRQLSDVLKDQGVAI